MLQNLTSGLVWFVYRQGGRCCLPTSANRLVNRATIANRWLQVSTAGKCVTKLAAAHDGLMIGYDGFGLKPFNVTSLPPGAQ